MLRRTFLKCLSGSFFAIAVGPVHAASNGKGEGNGNGNGAGRGNGGSSGGGKSGNGPSNGKGVGPDSPGKGQTKTQKEPLEPQRAPVAIDRTVVYRVKHGNGFRETIEQGRYVLQDNRGRTIVDRAAKSNDYARLRKLSRPSS